MRIVKLDAKRFGSLKDFKCDIDAPLVVIQGLNESGKSTTFELLLTLLCGFQNAGNKRNFKLLPKVLPWSGDMPHIEGTLDCDDGKGCQVVRAIDKNAPADYLVKNSRQIPLAEDEHIPSLGGMGRETFTTMYALDLSQMTNLKRNWENVRERLLGGLYPACLKSYKDMERGIQDRMKLLWKDERATKLSKDLQKKIDDTKQMIGELRQKQHVMRDMEIEIAKHRMNIKSYEEESRQLETDGRQRRVDRQVVGALKVVHHLERRAGDISEFTDIPEHPMEEYRNQREIIKGVVKKVEELKEQGDQLVPTIKRYDDDQRKIMENKDRIQDLKIKKQEYDNETKQLDTLRRKLEKASAEIESMAHELLTSTDGNWKDMILNLDLATLKSAVESHDYYEELRLKRLGISPNSGHKSLPWRVLGGFSLMLIALIMVMLNQPIIGAGMGLGGIILWIIAAIKRNRRRLDRQNGDTEYDRDIESSEKTWKKILDRVPLPEEWLERPDRRSYERIKQINSQLTMEADDLKQCESLEQRCIDIKQGIKDEIKSLLNRDTSMSVGIAQLEEALQKANDVYSRCQNAQTQLKFIQERIEEEKGRGKEAEAAIEALTKEVAPLGESNMEDNIKLLLERRKAHAEARRRRRDLEVQFENFEALEKRALTMMGKDFDFEDAKDKERVEVLEQSLKEATAAKTKLETRLGLMVKNGEAPADKEAELLALEAERAQRIHQRDQLALALAMIKTGREQFMEHHRPEFMEKAQRYLATITGGKYNRIALDESGQDFVIDLNGVKAHGAQEFSDKLSQGTLEQVYMALRLAMLEQLDPAGERLPLILDEALVNWDRVRRGNFHDVLREIIPNRQVILFTCHDDMTKHLKDDGLKPLVVKI